jgi:hypothetical protein
LNSVVNVTRFLDVPRLQVELTATPTVSSISTSALGVQTVIYRCTYSNIVATKIREVEVLM